MQPPLTPPPVRSCIVLGTGPGAGQTLVTTALVQSLCRLGVAAIAMKTVPGAQAAQAAGSDELRRLAAVSAFGLPSRALCAALPEAAAARTRRAQAFDGVVDTFRVLSTWADAVVVDGAAASAPRDRLAVARALGLPFVLVVGLGRGCVEAAARQARALVDARLECAGWVANQAGPVPPDAEALLAALRDALPGPWLGSIPRLAATAPESAAQALDLPRTLQALAA